MARAVGEGLTEHDIVGAEVLAHLGYTRPGRYRHPAQPRHLPHHLPAMIQRLAAAIAIESKAFQQRPLVWVDELGKHTRAHPHGLLTLGKAPHVHSPHVGRIIARRGQLIGPAKAARPHVSTAGVERKQPLALQKIHHVGGAVSQECHESVYPVRPVVHVHHQVLQAPQVDELPGQAHGPPPGRVTTHRQQVAKDLLRQSPHSIGSLVIDVDLGIVQPLHITVIVLDGGLPDVRAVTPPQTGSPALPDPSRCSR